MPLLFSEYPGRRERHLLRKRDNPLFPEAQRTISSHALQEAQRLDHEEIVAFLQTFQGLMAEAARLGGNVGSEVILGLKERLDQAYEQACGLGDDQTETKQALGRLIEVIMRAVIAGAGNDPVARSELEQEQAARGMHFALLEAQLVADLLHPESPIPAPELAPSLLSAGEEELELALELFDPAQLEQITAEARALLAGLDPVPGQAPQRLAQIERRLQGRVS